MFGEDRAGGSPQWPTKEERAQEVEASGTERFCGRHNFATYSPLMGVSLVGTEMFVSHKLSEDSFLLSLERGQLWAWAWPTGLAPLGPQPFPDLTRGGRDTYWAGDLPALEKACEQGLHPYNLLNPLRNIKLSTTTWATAPRTLTQ